MQSAYMEDRDGISVLNIKGRLDASNSGQVHEKIMSEIDGGKNKIVVNFSDVSYISSAGLRVIVYASKALSKKQGSFSLCSISGNIEKVFQISGLASLFDIHKDVESSLQAMKD